MRQTEPLGKLEDNNCFACGPSNPIGLHLTFQQGDGYVEARFTPQPDHVGWTRVVHGGILSTLLDEAMAYALYFARLPGVTARFEARFRRPLPPGTELKVRGRVIGERRGLIDAEAKVTDPDGEVIAEAAGRFVGIDADNVVGPRSRD